MQIKEKLKVVSCNCLRDILFRCKRALSIKRKSGNPHPIIQALSVQILYKFKISERPTCMLLCEGSFCTLKATDLEIPGPRKAQKLVCKSTEKS